MECWYRNVCNEAKDNCAETCIRFSEMNYLIANSNIPTARRRAIPLSPGDDYPAFCELDNIRKDIVNFVNNGEDLYITSEFTGNGKTSWSIKLLMKYFNEVWAGNGYRTRGLFVYVPQLLLQLKDFNNPLSAKYKQNLLDCDLVVWDDIGSTEISNYDMSQLLVFIDQRIMNGKSNIFTGNLTTKAKITNALGERLASRIWNTSTVIEFVGKDRRDGSVANSI